MELDKEELEEEDEHLPICYDDLSTGLKWFVVLGWINITLQLILPLIVLLLAGLILLVSL